MSEEKLRDELKAAQERVYVLENIMDSLPSMIGYWDHNLINHYSNPAYQEYFNKTREQIEGRHIRDVIGEELYNKNIQYMLKALEGVQQTFERDIPTPDGRIKHTHAHYIPDTRHGKVHGFFVLVVDVTPLKIASKEKEQIYQQLSESYKMVSLGEMAGGVAHEINTPLAVIATNIGMMQQSLEEPHVDKEKLKRYVGNIHKTVARISKVVTGLLHFSKDRRDEEFKLISVQSILEDTIPFCSERFKNHGVKLNFPEDVRISINCRAVEISQVLVNLLNNAFDAIVNNKEKWVSVEVVEDNEYVDIAVTDSGNGIAPELQSSLMMPFFTTKEVGKGTGLGLSISKGIIESHKGTLFLDTRSAHTKFIVRLPKTHRT